MPSNEERREVAARLRQWADTGDYVEESAWLLADVVRTATNKRHGNVDGVMRRLADLIEPEPQRTCHNIHPDVFQCSECYAIDEDWKHPPFCHGCGAKVVEE